MKPLHAVTSMHFALLIGAWTTQLLALPLPPQEACGENACSTGYTCERQLTELCSPCPPSAPGQTQEPCASDCETVSTEVCRPALCETDEDCGETMKCHTFTPTPTPSACFEESCEDALAPKEYRECTPRSALPCETNSDCGPNYICITRYQCPCAGTTPGAPTPGDGTPTPSPSGTPNCPCQPSVAKRCQAQRIECLRDSDCPTDWFCDTQSNPCANAPPELRGCDVAYYQCQPRPLVFGGHDGDTPSHPLDSGVQLAEVPHPPTSGCSLDPRISRGVASPYALMALLGAAFLVPRRATSPKERFRQLFRHRHDAFPCVHREGSVSTRQ
jgi:hypothetical protein